MTPKSLRKTRIFRLLLLIMDSGFILVQLRETIPLAQLYDYISRICSNFAWQARSRPLHQYGL